MKDMTQIRNAMKIVDMMCDGYSYKEIEKELGISHNTLERRLSSFRHEALLPYNKASFPRLRDHIMSNMRKWADYQAAQHELHSQYHSSLHHVCDM